MHETRWLNAAWVLLLVATAITYVLGEMGLVSQAGGWFLAGLGVLTVVKGIVVIQVFLEMRHAPALWRWLLLAAGARLAFGGGIFPSVATGGLLGVGLGSALGLDPTVSGLIGATAFLTVTLNVPVGAALLAVAWGGDAMLPVVLVEQGAAPSQVAPLLAKNSWPAMSEASMDVAPRCSP